MKLAIETEKLTRRFGDHCAVDHIDLSVERGTFYGFLGPNGAGKSTTIKMLTGLLEPTSGVTEVLGMNPRVPQDAMEIKKRVGVVPEGLALFGNLTAREHLTFVGRMYLMSPEILDKRIEELLAAMELANEKKLTMEFSHGMQKKLALAAALLPDPELLFLDEPFEGVDAVASRMIRDILRRTVERGATVFLTSHVLDIVENLCTHVGIIHNGKLVEQTTLSELGTSGSLEDRFLEVVGEAGKESVKLSWLEGEVT